MNLKLLLVANNNIYKLFFAFLARQFWGRISTTVAKIIKDGKEADVKDGESIIAACKDVGVSFGCHAGMCRTCEIEVIDGADNLTDVTENENMMGVERPKRLACQCRIKGGTVKIRTEEQSWTA